MYALQGAACGTGTQTRNVSCVVAGTSRPVQAGLCRAGNQSELAANRKCYLSCHHDCTVSEWGVWSECSAPYCTATSTAGVRSRVRVVVQAARPPHGLCPAQLQEEDNCNAPPCYRYGWVVRQGEVFCQRSDGARVQGGYYTLGNR